MHPNRSRIMANNLCFMCRASRSVLDTRAASASIRASNARLWNSFTMGVTVIMHPLSTRGIHGLELETCVKGVRGCVHVVNGGLIESLEGIVGFPFLSAQAQGHPAGVTFHVDDVAHSAAMRDKLPQFRKASGMRRSSMAGGVDGGAGSASILP